MRTGSVRVLARSLTALRGAGFAWPSIDHDERGILRPPEIERLEEGLESLGEVEAPRALVYLPESPELKTRNVAN